MYLDNSFSLWIANGYKSQDIREGNTILFWSVTHFFPKALILSPAFLTGILVKVPMFFYLDLDASNTAD